MSDFDGQLIELQDSDQLLFACLLARDKNRLRVLNEQGREQRIAEGRIVWRYDRRIAHPTDWPQALDTLRARVDELQAEVDIPLLWETVSDTPEAWEIADLADLYFSAASPAHRSALWRALAEENQHFRRKGHQWVTRSAAQIAELQAQQQREAERAAFAERREAWLREVFESEEPMAVPEEMEPVLDQVATFLERRGTGGLGPLLESLSSEQAAAEIAFDLLLTTGRLSEDADPDLLLAGLDPDFPPEVVAAAAALTPFVTDPEETVLEVLGSIDDEDTREVDDALGVTREGDRWRVDIVIADTARYIRRSSELEAEAARRSTTVYLPTQTVLMLPERVSCDLGSLTADVPRPGVIIQVWFDDAGNICDNRLERGIVRVGQRLHYEEVDALLAAAEPGTEGPLVEALQTLAKIADQRREMRARQGAITQRRGEWKVTVTNGEIIAKPIPSASPSRQIVSEMMILANSMAAEFAEREDVPILFRTQEAPLEPLPPQDENDPLAFERIRRFFKPASLSLFPAPHFGLGLEAYTQLTSPLRRFADLVTQRQLLAHLAGEDAPYSREELLTVLATAETVERDIRRVELHSSRRWLIEYLLRYRLKEEWEVLVLEALHGGYRVELVEWGLTAFLASRTPIDPGTHLPARIHSAQPRRGRLRLRPV